MAETPFSEEHSSSISFDPEQYIQHLEDLADEEGRTEYSKIKELSLANLEILIEYAKKLKDELEQAEENDEDNDDVTPHTWNVINEVVRHSRSAIQQKRLASSSSRE